MHRQGATNQRNQRAMGEQPATGTRRIRWLDDK